MEIIKNSSGGNSAELTDHIENTTNAHGIDGLVTKATVTAKGDILVATGGGAVTKLAVGSDGAVLKADSGQASGLIWGSVAASQPHPFLLF